MAPSALMMSPSLFLVLLCAFTADANPFTSADRLFTRQNGCIECNVSCPICAKGESCVQSSRTCDTCPVARCVALPSSDTSSHSKTAIGPIVGGVVGGVAVVGLVAYLVWKKFLKKKRRETMQREKLSSIMDDFSAHRSARESTHTVASIASTVFTRASNVIQIAYVPGVTTRSAPNSPGIPPPMPPLPLTNPSKPWTHQSGDVGIGFSADDLMRASFASKYTLDPDAISLDPRASVATTAYRSTAIVSPVPATAVRVKANLVQVKQVGAGSTSSGATSPAASTPPVPTIEFSKHGLSGPKAPFANGDSSNPPHSPAFSVGSTFLNKNASQKRSRDTIASNLSRRSNVTSARLDSQYFDDSDLSEEEEADFFTASPAVHIAAQSKQTSQANNHLSTATTESADLLSPFSDASSIKIDDMPLPPARRVSTGDLVIQSAPPEESSSETQAMITPQRRLSVIGEGDSESGSIARGKSPFGDENRIGQ